MLLGGAFFLATLSLAARAVAGEPALDIHALSAAADAAVRQIANYRTNRGPEEAVGLDPAAWPQHFAAEYTLMTTSAAQNTTYTGTVWASTPSKQLRYSGKQTTVFSDGTSHHGTFTWIESAVTGLKTLFAPDPNSADPSAPSVLCRSQPMTEEERGAKGGYVFADNTLIDTRIVGVYFDTSVPQPAMQAIFVDPFANEPAAMITKGARGVDTTMAVYENMRPAMSGTVHSQFSVPPGMKCTSGQVPMMPKAWLWA